MMRSAYRLLVAAVTVAYCHWGAGAGHCAEVAPLKLVMLSGSDEYKSDITLAAFGDYLRERWTGIEPTLVKAVGTDNLPGVEALDTADAALFFTRRLTLPAEQLEHVKRYCASGKPIIGVRTASHGIQNWLEFDKEVLGGNYQNHHGAGRTLAVKATEAGKLSPILDGVRNYHSRGSLYKNTPLAADCVPLMIGTIPNAPPEPVMWTRERNGGRVFYTSIGAPTDFENDTYRRVLARAILWSARREDFATFEKPLAAPPPLPAPKEGAMSFPVRRQVETLIEGKGWDEQTEEATLPVAKTALVICDMWDKHWCDGATARVEEIARRLDPVVRALRAKGVLIIHAPSDTLDFYADAPQRRRMQALPKPVKPAERVMHEAPLPIDDKDGGCDTQNTPQYHAWTRQHPGIGIEPEDGISDTGEEVLSLFQQRGIENVLYAGVHTNMCVLARTFAIRQMTRWGLNCILIRDLTDAMYDPLDKPNVSHAEGTGLVIEHIEKYWAGTVASDELLAGLPK